MLKLRDILRGNGTRSRSWRYLAGLSSGYALTFATIAVGLWLTPFTLRFLDREEYAIFALTGDVITWLSLLDLGITAGLRVQAAQLTGQPDQEKVNRLASTGFFAQIIIVVMVLAAGVVVASVFPQFFQIRAELHQDAALLVLFMVAGLGMSMATQTFSALLVANQQIHVDNAIGFLNLFLRAVLTVVLLMAGWGLYSLAAANFAAKGLSSGLAVARTFRLIPGLRIRRDLASWDTLKGIGNVGVWFSLGSLAGIINTALDGVMTAKIVSVETVTTLTLTGRLYFMSRGLLGQITDTARPMLGQMFGQKKHEHALKTYRHLFMFSTGISVAAAASIWAGNGSFVTRWVGQANYGGTALDIALALNLILFAWLLPNRAVLSAGLVVRPQVICRIIEGVLNLALSVVLGLALGVFGIVLASAIACVVSSWWYLPLLTARLFGRSFRGLFWGDAGRMVMLMVCLFPVAFGFQAIALQLGGFVGAGFGIAATGSVGILLVWFLVLNAELRARGLSVLAEVLPFRKITLETKR